MRDVFFPVWNPQSGIGQVTLNFSENTVFFTDSHMNVYASLGYREREREQNGDQCEVSFKE